MPPKKQDVVKHKTSLNLDVNVWRDWVQYVVTVTGSTMQISKLTEIALKNYMKQHKIPEGRTSVVR